MSVQTAEIVFFAIAGVMAAVWLWGTLFAFRRLRPQGRGEYDVAPSPEDDAANTVIGEATIEGDAEAISKKIAEQLVAGTSMGGMSPLEITGRTAELVTFKRSMGPGGPAAVFDEGLFRLKPEGNSVHVQYAVSMKRFATIMKVVTYLVCFVWGGIWAIGVPVFIWMYVVHNANEDVRWQTFQTLQMVHGVWPPFLVGFLGGKLRRMTSRFFEMFLSNLQHIA